MAQFGVTGGGYQDPFKGYLLEKSEKADTSEISLPKEGISDCFNE